MFAKNKNDPDLNRSFLRFLFLFLALTLILFIVLAPFAKAQEILPLSLVKPGDKGYGLTVFKGTEPEKFNFEVEGVLNEGEFFIVVRLFGGPKDENGMEILKKTHVLAGMSGSPLYLDDGRIIGAVSSTLESEKSPIAFVTPIEFLVGFKPQILEQPNKLVSPDPELLTYLNAHLFGVKPGEMYAFCEVWGDDSECSAGTLTMLDANDPTMFYSLGHPGSQIGVSAFPFWKASVVTVVPRVDFSTKIINKVGPPVGSVVFNGPYGQILKLGYLPEFFPLSLRLEGYLPSVIENIFYFAYAPQTSGNVIKVLAAKQSIVDNRLLDLDSEVRINAAGFKQIYSQGILDINGIGAEIKMLTKNGLSPTIDSVRIILKARPKHKVLELHKVTPEIKKNADGSLAVKLSISAAGDADWTNTSSWTVDKKYLGKELYISNGGELTLKMLPYLKRDEQAVDLLNKISDRNALYMYYFDPEDLKTEKSQPRLILTLAAQTAKFKNAGIPPAGTNADGPVKDWSSKPRDYHWDILAQIKVPDSDYLINGEKSFTVQLPDAPNDNGKKNIKKRKKLFIF